MTDADPGLMTLFAEALERTDPAERAAYLEAACRGDVRLRRKVEALLLAHQGAGQFLEPDATGVFEPGLAETREVTRTHVPQGSSPSGAITEGFRPAHEVPTIADAPPAGPVGEFVPGRVIAGRYTLVGVLGEGGMGAVYRADQSHPVRRQVALKVIKLGMDSRSVLARFDAERQALALMDHPNIARVYDGGTTETNQPFFVMELVSGEPITEYCDHNRLPVRARLELFVAACQAVQHAHQKGIIHRDLKPSNVMVTEVDGRPTPKVIDFGVAKATDFDLTDQSLGDTGAIVGTPTYMSPEQADPSSMDIDTRTDVYALGVILYELMAGSPPLDASHLKRGALLEMLRMIREVDPPRPSTKIGSAEALPSIAACRDISPQSLKRALRGDLDWIAMKALEKDRTRRYETANGLAADVLRHLASEPVLAAPPSRSYRLEKFARKHRGGVIAASLVVLALLAGIAGTTLGMIQAKRSSAKALEAGRLAELSRLEAVAAGRRADEGASTARRAVNDYLDRITTSAQLRRPGLSGLRRDLLTQALRYYEGFLLDSANDPVLQAEAADAQNRAAMILLELGDSTRAAEAARRAIALNERLIRARSDEPASRRRLASSLVSLGNALRTTRRSEESIAAFRRSAEISEANLRDRPDDHDAAANLGTSWSNLAKTLSNSGKTAEADEILARDRTFLEAFVARDPVHPRPRDLLADILHQMGDHASDRDEFEPARALYRQALEIREALVREQPDDWWQSSQLARIDNELGMLHSHKGLNEEALAYLEKGRAIRERLLAGEPASAELKEYLSRSLDNLGNLYNTTGKPEAALPLFERGIELRGQLVALDPTNATILGALGGSLHNRGMSMERLGRNLEAERLYREAMTRQRRALEIQPEITVHRTFLTNHLINLADLLRRTGRVDEAARLGEEAAGLWPPEQVRPLMRSALFLADCVGSVGPGDSAQEKASRDRIGRATVEVLNKAVGGGVRALDFFRSSPQLEPIRDRDDFKELLARLERSAASKP